jgi:hypothetical protein
VRRRVPELATSVLDALGKIKITGKVSDEVASIIRRRCERVCKEFRN